MATSISTFCGEHLWAALKAIDFGGRVVEWPSLKQCASRAAQRSNNEQQIAANNKTSPRI
jgi:hypothetical protein